ncbi:winged helix-turn-helix domain-containing protein [Kitasatospora paracochleata]|uniref:DNA-binding transcriptional ArsR family regulator n=1 Tax=Kitasatospora paracochleata TaxID=58354 RepID=A0ABT1J203_9ACTN|nr:winged helix-turn-helix domain-containing protein [Kitasatospora paracochleata]MCP2311454.1 DNA-binding transcriptional ArsR family regulator [Kitasatospora paracochleata]
MTEPQPAVRSLDPRSLRGLAHPLRMRLLAALREDGPATATRLAARLGESSASVSYHLRQLGAHGFIAEDPDRGTTRERWWRAEHRGHRFDSLEEFLENPDPEVRGAMGVFLNEVAAVHDRELSGWLATAAGWPAEWRRSWDMSDFTLRLTPELTRELAERAHELVQSFRDRAAADGDSEQAVPVRIHLHAFPLPTDGRQASRP